MMKNNTNTAQSNASFGIIDLSSKYVRSFSTHEMLAKKLSEYGIDKKAHIVCRTPSGRWTAIVCGFQQDLLATGWPMISTS